MICPGNSYIHPAKQFHLLIKDRAIVFFYDEHHLIHSRIIKLQPVFYFNIFLNNRGCLQGECGHGFIGIDQTRDTQQNPAEISYNDYRKIRQLLTIDLPEYWFARAAGRFAVVTAAKTISIRAYAIRKTMMSRLGMLL